MTASISGGRHALPGRVTRAVPRILWSVVTDLFAFLGKRMLIILALGSVAIAGAVGASAATLGGLRTNDLGATSGTVASHTSGITITWGSRWSGTAMVLDSVTVTTTASQPFVAGETVKGVIVNSAGTALCTVTSVVATTSTTEVLARSGIEAACGTTPFPFSSIDTVALVVNG